MPLITGTSGDDSLTGTNDADTIDLLEGNDVALGLGGDDVIDGGDGADQLLGDGGASYLGPSGNDTLNGGAGNDIMWGGAGVDTFNGGEGRDRVSFYSLAATQGASANLLTQTISNDGYGNAETMTSIESLGAGTAFADSFTGDDGFNLLFAGFGDSVIANGGDDIVFMDSAPALLDGGAGNDTIGLVGDINGMLVADSDGDGLAEIVFAANGAYVDLRAGFIFDDGFGNATAILNFENVDGSELGDTIVGDDGVNMLNGWGGDDVVIGFAGDDYIDGGEGNDQLRGDGTSSYNGASGNDIISGGGGDDIMWGGAGIDYFDGGDGVDRVSFYNRAATQGAVASLVTQTISNDGYGNAETMVSVEGLGAGTAFADSFTGDDNANLLWSGLGDTVIANGGDDTIIVDSAALLLDGGGGIDTIQFQGDQTGMLIADTTGDGLAEIVFATSGVNVNLRSNAIFDDGFGNFGTIANIENVDGSLLDDFIQGSDVANVLNGLDGLDVIRGFGGDDTIDGGAGDDNLAGDGAFNYNGPSGNDLISGGAGDDLMRGGAGVDTFDGGDGADRVSFYSIWATQAVVADLNTQTISNDGYGNAETMTSVEGLGAGTVFADTFIGNDAANTLLGDTGDTVIANGGDDFIQASGAPAVVDGGAGVDTISLAQGVTLQADNNGDGAAEEVLATAGYTIDLSTGELQDEWGGVGSVVNVENVDGSSFDDNITGDDGANIINAGEGNDIVVGLGGDDVIDGGEGADQLRGDGGAAYTGPSGDDTLSGGAGNDTLWGGAGVDTFDGGDGRDRVSFYSLAATQGAIANLVTQTISNDGYGNAETMISIESLGAGTAFADSFTGDDGSNLLFAGFGDTVIANGGNDTVFMDSAPAVLDGGTGNDTLAFAGDTNGMLIADTNGDGLAEIVLATVGVEVDLRAGFVFNDGFGNLVAISGFENVDGSELGDMIVGDDDLNMLNGWGGDDAVIGFGGDDFIDGGEGNDQLRGDGTPSYTGPSGNDVISGGGGDDIMWGGAGIDYFDGGDGFDRVSFYNRAATQGAIASLITQTISNDGYGNAETMISIEGLGAGTAFADSFTGDDNANLLWSGLGDTVIANGGDDTIIVDSAALMLDGGDGVDTIQFQGDQTGMLIADNTGDGLAEVVFATSGVNVNLRSNAIFDDGFGNFGSIANIENVDGSLLDDFIQGSDVANVLNGLDGADVIRGFGGDDIINGGDGDDNLAGDGAFNYNGPSGNDVISGGDGDDLMRGGAGVDTFDGGDGDNDRVSFYSVWATQAVVANLITQTISNDGYGNAETMISVEGLGAGTVFADTYIGNDAANTLLGDTGDTVTANGGDDFIQASGAPAVVDGGAGVDTISLAQGVTLQADNNGDGAAEEVLATAGYTIDLSTGVLQDEWGGVGSVINVENVDGSAFSDNITGDDSNNVINAAEGNDVVLGFGGDDTINGGDGNDQLRGDGGPTYVGPSGNDTLVGGAGNDIMWGGAGVDSYDGGDGADRVSFYALNATQGAVVNLFTQTIGNDGFGNAETMVGIENLGSGTAFADSFTGNDNANFIMAGYGDSVLGNGGDDTIWIEAMPAVVDGGAGIDAIGFTGDTTGMLTPDTTGDGLAEVVFASAGVYVDLGAGYVFDDGFGHEGAISGFENVDGSELGDTIIGEGSANWLNGWGGDDAILGLGGDDIVFGGDGNDQLRGDGGSSGLGPFGDDQLFGDAGDDYMNGGAGIDYFDGGDGADRVSFYNRSATQGAVASLITQTIGNDGFGNAETMVSVEGLGAGTAYADLLTGDDGANFMYAGLGDTILTNGGDDTIQVDSAALMLDGGAGVDTIQFVGDVNGMLVIDNTGDGLAEIAFATTGVQVSLRSNAIFDDGFGNFGTIHNIENVDGSLLDDTIQGNDAVNVLNGLDGADLILGYGGNDVIDGGAGDDQLRGEAGATYNGPSGNDQISGGDGDDYLNGGAGVDTFDGGAGTDRVSFYSYAATQGVVASLITQTISNDGFGNAETMMSIEGLGGGTAFADTFIGDDDANLILAENGDTVQANGGDDTFQLSGGPALIDGGAGVDTILAFTGDTTGALTPDTNADGLAELVFAIQGVRVDLRTNQILNDGFGHTGVILNVENVGGSTLSDTLFGDNINGNVLTGYDGDDTLSGFGGNDTLNGGAGNDTLNGGTGIDTASYADETDAMFIDLAAGTARRGSAAAAVEDTLVSIENVIGGSGDDTIVGSSSVNTLSGGAGNDTIVGGGAGDTIRGDDGDDTITGAAGADTIDAGAGNDTIIYTIGNGVDVTDGGADTDTLAVLGTAANNTLSVTFDGATFTAFSGGALANIEVLTADLGGGIDTLAYTTSADVSVDLAAGSASGFGAIAGIENVTTGSGNDTLVGDGGANRLTGGAGDDTYHADSSDTIVEASGGGVDFVYTASGSFTLSANVENLTYTGVGSFAGVGNGIGNVISGGAAGDNLSGGGGNDTLIGGGGDDVMNGGSGNDTFVLSAGGGHDTINGFDANLTGGQDLLDLTAYGITSADFAARVSIVDLGSDTQIVIDGMDIVTLIGVNGTGSNVITQGDFILGGG